MLRLDLTQIEIFFVFKDFSPLCALKNYETCVRCCVAKQGINNVLSGNNEENYFFEEPFVKFFFKTKKIAIFFFLPKTTHESDDDFFAANASSTKCRIGKKRGELKNGTLQK